MYLYIIKNFEAKGILYEQSKEKLLKLFIEYNQKNLGNNHKIKYPLNEFNLIWDEYSKIILNILDKNNNYNYILTKIFMKALFYNSNCAVNKLIEYFTVLFSYTRNHFLEENKLLLN